jgi:pimeloyl-ACP methyl ester carboxylesterase
MVTESELDLGNGQLLHYYDTADGPTDDIAVFWHHGTPNLGLPPEPLFPAAAELGLRWVSYDRPSYGGSTPAPGREVAAAAACTAAVADALGIGRFAVVGHSGGGPHALACASLLPDRVMAAVSIAGLAPYSADGLDWYAGMCASGEASLRAAAKGRAAKQRYESSGPDGDLEFTPADNAMFDGPWHWIITVVGPALEAGPDGLIDDDVAYVNPWGFDPAQISVPVLLLHGGKDRVVPSSHSQWLAAHIPGAELWHSPDDGHISVLSSSPSALRWLSGNAVQ